MAEFLEFLQGKKFVYHPLSIGGYGEQTSSLREFSDAIVTSPDVIEVKLAALAKPEDLISIFSLLEKLPNCKGVQIGDLTITEQTAPYLSKLISLPWIRAIPLQQCTFTPEACQAFAASMDPERFLILSLEECNIPNAAPIINALINANIDELPSFIDRPVTDEECSALANLIKHNKHIKIVLLSALSNKNSREIAEALRYNESLEMVRFYRCDLTTAIPAITESLGTFKVIPYLSVSFCNITLALLTDLCNGIKQQKTVVRLDISDNNYNDSLEPITMLLESNAPLVRLALRNSSSIQEWISLFNALKKNTTLTEFNFTLLPEPNDHIVEELVNVLKVNNTLRSVRFDTYLFVPVLDQLISVVVSQNKLESFSISHGQLRDMSFATLCGMLKKNRTLHRFNLGSELEMATSDEKVQLFNELMEQNYFLLKCDIVRDAYQLIKPFKERNEEYQKGWSELKQNMVVLLHNMARNAETIRKLLPLENWIEIFKRVTHRVSLANGFEDAAKKIFKHYNLY